MKRPSLTIKSKTMNQHICMITLSKIDNYPIIATFKNLLISYLRKHKNTRNLKI